MKARIGFTLVIILALASLTAVVPKALAGDYDWRAALARQYVQGTWFGTGTNGCLVAAPGTGFTDTLVPTGGVSFQSSTVQGTLNIKADGTGTGEFTEFPLTHPPAAGVGASSSKYSVSYTYTFADDGTLTVTFLSVAGEVLAGPSAGVSFNLTPPPLTGRISRDGNIMLLSTEAPTANATASSAVETLQIVGGPSFHRICSRMRVFARIHASADN